METINMNDGAVAGRENEPPVSRKAKERRKSTGIIKLGLSKEELLSPKPNQVKKRRRKSMGKRVSFGGVDVRVFRKDIEWANGGESKDKQKRSVDIGNIPFNDVMSPPKQAAPSRSAMLSPVHNLDMEQSMAVPEHSVKDVISTQEMGQLLALIQEEAPNKLDNSDDMDSDEMTMDFTRDHGKIISVAPSTMHDPLEEDDEPAEVLQNNVSIVEHEEQTMEMTVNHSNILEEAQPNDVDSVSMSDDEVLDEQVDQDMEITHNHSSIKMLSPGDQVLEVAAPNSSVPVEGAVFEMTGDVTRVMRGQMEKILQGEAEDKTLDLPKHHELLENELAIAQRFQEIIDTENNTEDVQKMLESVIEDQDDEDDVSEEIKLPDLDEFIGCEITRPEPLAVPLTNSSNALSSAPIEDESVIQSFEEFCCFIGIRFLDNVSSRKTNSFGLGPVDTLQRSLSDQEKLSARFSTFTIREFYSQRCAQLHDVLNTLKSTTREMERWVDDERPDIFTEAQMVQNPDDMRDMKSQMKRLKQKCRLLAKQKWRMWQLDSDKELMQILESNLKALQHDAETVESFSKNLESAMLMHEQSNSPQIIGLREAIEEQAEAIETFYQSKVRVEQELQAAQNSYKEAVMECEQLSTECRALVTEEFSRNQTRRELQFAHQHLRMLKSCVGWHVIQCNAKGFMLGYESLPCSVLLTINGLDNNGVNLSLEISPLPSADNETAFYNVLMQTANFGRLSSAITSKSQLNDGLVEIDAVMEQVRQLQLEISALSAERFVFLSVCPNTGMAVVDVHLTSLSSKALTIVSFGVCAGYPYRTLCHNVQSVVGAMTKQRVESIISTQPKNFRFLTSVCSQILQAMEES